MSTAYSQRCYNATNNEECSPFAATIQWTTDWEAPCPFNETMCLSAAMQLDTELLNSNTILGVNSPVKDQIEFRKMTTCAPITHENYTRSVNVTGELPGDEFIAYTYSSDIHFDDSGLVFSVYVADQMRSHVLR